jgi:dihydroorotase
MASKILLRNVRPFVNGVFYEPCDMLLDGGKWVDAPSTGAQVFDCEGALALPSLYALGVDFQDPARDDIYTLADGFLALRRGGFSGALYESAANPIDEIAKLKTHRDFCASSGLDISPLGAFSKGFAGKHLAEMRELAEGELGVAGFGDGGKAVGDLRFLRLAMEYGAMCGRRFFLHPQEATLARIGQVHEGTVSDTLGMKGIPQEAETIAVYEILSLARWLQVPVHLRCVTTAASLEQIRKARADGMDVTCDVGLYHLLFDDSSLLSLDSHYYILPPLRSSADREALWAGLLDGTIQGVSANHTPVLPEDKSVNFEDAAPGAVSLEVMLSALWEAAKDRTGGHPERILDWVGAGTPLSKGGEAQLVVFDPVQKWTVNESAFAGQVHNSPLLGKEIKGKILGTYLGGVWYS